MSYPLNKTNFSSKRDFDGRTYDLARAFRFKDKAKKYAEGYRGTETTSYGDTNRKYARVIEGKATDKKKGNKTLYGVYLANEIK